MSKNYRIGEMADSFGISTDTLRLYDRMGILPAEKSEGNNYRSYSRADFITLSQIVLLRRCGMPLEEIRTLVCGGTPEESLQQLKEYNEELRQRIEELSRLSSAVEERCLIDELLVSLLGQIVLTVSPRFILCPCEDQVMEATGKLEKALPGTTARMGFLLPKKRLTELYDGNTGSAGLIPPEQWGVKNAMLVRDEQSCFEPDRAAELEVFPARRCLATGVYCVQGHDYSAIRTLYEAARDRGMKITGDMLILIVSLRNGERHDRDYYLVWLPVE